MSKSEKKLDDYQYFENLESVKSLITRLQIQKGLSSSDDEDDISFRMNKMSEPPLFNITEETEKAESQKMWVRFDSHLCDFLCMGEMAATLRAPRFGYPKLSKFVCHDEPIKVEEPAAPAAGADSDTMSLYQSNQAAHSAYLQAIAKYSAAVNDFLKLVESSDFRKKVLTAQVKQQCLRGILRSICKGNTGALDQIDGVESSAPVGQRVYAALRSYAMKTNRNADAVDDFQTRVLDIPVMGNSYEVERVLTDYKSTWGTWKGKFTKTVDDPTPWYNKVTASLIAQTILKRLPRDSPHWMSFRVSLSTQFKTLSVEEAFLALEDQLSLIRDSNNGTLDGMAMSLAVGDNGGKPIDCKLCLEKGVTPASARAHKPNEAACPYHGEWKLKAESRRTQYTNDKKTPNRGGRRGNNSNGGSGSGGGGRGAKKQPSAEHPCNICKSPDHWAPRCPQKTTFTVDQTRMMAAMMASQHGNPQHGHQSAIPMQQPMYNPVPGVGGYQYPTQQYPAMTMMGQPPPQPHHMQPRPLPPVWPRRPHPPMHPNGNSPNHHHQGLDGQ